MTRYNPKEIEGKWQKIWDQTQVYKANLDSEKPKYIAMSMFNYPSGAGIHIGHAMNYTISDVMARLKRQQGYESYHPVGWDSFGLPAENYAIKAGVSPHESMDTIIPSYHTQYKAMGWSNDWSKEIATHTPEYYKWTQWVFSQMYRQGLAYQDARMQWWCNQCQTVLANEQVIDGKCWRHDKADDPDAVKKEVKQWFFKITDYADELLDSIDELDWTDSVKQAQRNWIGRSIGAEIDFKVADSDETITVFTTRPDTLFGATYMVLAPEHELVRKVTTKDQQQVVEAYVKTATAKSELERKQEKEKTGVFTGGYAINPVNDEQIPIWIADYVLTGYGTGAIMAVPAHDERDNEFAKEFNLPIVEVVESSDEQIEEVFTEEGELINSGSYNGLDSSTAREQIVTDLARNGVAREQVNYKMRDWSVSRQRYWGAPIPIVNCEDCGPVLVPDDQLPVVLPELDDFQPSGDGRSALARATEWLKVDCPQCGKPAERETDTLDTYICSSWYMYRYFDPHNDQEPFSKERVVKWAPIDFYNGADHATAHLLYARFIARFFTNIGIADEPEPFKKFLFNGKVTAEDGTMFSKSLGNGIDPLEVIDSGYGADALRLYLMFAAPLDQWMKWSPKGVPGTYRYLNRVWDFVQEFLQAKPEQHDDDVSELETAVMGSVHRAIKKVTDDMEHLSFNTAIAAQMKLNNELREHVQKLPFSKAPQTWMFAIDTSLKLLAPFAPHITEELWNTYHQDKTSIHTSSWPVWDEELVKEELVTVVVQINGKVRAQLELVADVSNEEMVEAAQADEKIAQYLKDGEVKKTITVPGKLVNFVIQ